MIFDERKFTLGRTPNAILFESASTNQQEVPKDACHPPAA
jgi:hypothetical protein